MRAYPKATQTIEYLIVVPVVFFQLDENNAACESAFAEHLKQLQTFVKEYVSVIHIVSPSMSIADFENNKGHLKILNFNNDNIRVTCPYAEETGRIRYTLRKLPFVYRHIKLAVKNASVVHSGPSNNPFRLFEIISIFLAARSNKPSVFVIDIDERESARMDYETGSLSKKSYLLRKYIYDPLLVLQINYAVKNCSLLLLKSKSLVDDFGKGASHVKNFLDTAHSYSDVISTKEAEKKVGKFGTTPFRLVYFGRLTEYKGIADMLSAVDLAVEKYNMEATLTVIGEGEQKDELIKKTALLKNPNIVKFIPALPYGQEFFNEIRNHDALLAAPQRQDTPRSVFDAMSNGLITIAYDTYYYRDLVSSGAVTVIPWKNIEAMSEKIYTIAQDHELRLEMTKSAVKFAQENTQERWLELREKWLKEAIIRSST